MHLETNETHRPDLTSWVDSANDPTSDFPIQNLPVCRFLRGEELCVGIAIGDKILDFGAFAQAFLDDAINLDLMELACLSDTRRALQNSFDSSASSEKKIKLKSMLLEQADANLVIPFDVRDYTDFYCSIYHATNVGKIFRPDHPLMENYKWIPIGYHGRASSILLTGTDFKRPKGQNRSDTEKPPVYIPSKALDYEAEIGFFVRRGNELGRTIPIERAEDYIYGLCIVNDWSARDIQGWEYQPLGPFLGKNFATSLSPYVVTMEALAPFRVPAFSREEGDPQPLDYLADESNQLFGGIDLKIEVFISSLKMREAGMQPLLLSSSNLKDLYWTAAQMLTHHASGGCNMQLGDLFASGTVSGKGESERGCLLEITERGKKPFELPSGEIRRFLEDYDEIVMKAYCARDGFRRIGLGECRGMVLPADQE